MIRCMVIAVFAAVVVAGVYSLSYASSCGGDAVHGKHAAAAGNEAAAGKETAVDAGNRICPVSGETVGAAGMEPATYVYEGKRYNFCCSSCIEEFKKDPQKYIQKVEEELKKRAIGS